jgi:hypothetical protein
MRDDSRAVSTGVGYVMNLSLATILMATLLVTAGSVVETQSETVVRDELDVVGTQLSAKMMAADRLVRAGSEDGATPTVAVEATLPSQVGQSNYRVDVSDGELVLQTTSPAVTVRVPFVTTTDVKATTVSGGPVRIEYEYDETEDVGALTVTQR